MLRLHCSNHHEADSAWRMLCTVAEDRFTPVELHLDGEGLLYEVVRLDDGSQAARKVS